MEVKKLMENLMFSGLSFGKIDSNELCIVISRQLNSYLLFTMLCLRARIMQPSYGGSRLWKMFTKLLKMRQTPRDQVEQTTIECSNDSIKFLSAQYCIGDEESGSPIEEVRLTVPTTDDPN
ncbi:hypothetical protein CRG98_014794 [Punica granatum]|uniref:Uncharacterized protein n=1 Tax=Punica granatum TaxID=22663 RepID=A0A2I0K8C0_PUNGR|nr:hypothetical protein CRG98_014794 [Punica granatum]